MSYFDLRHVLLLVLNVLKSQTSAMPWEWDPFAIIAGLTWTKFWLLLVLGLFVFSFVSIGIPLAPTTGHVRVQIKNLSPSFLTCFLAVLFLPQILFWYIYPVITLFVLYYSCLSHVFRSFVFWAQAVTSVLPNLNVFITTNDGEVSEEGGGGGGADIEEGTTRP